MKKLLQIIIFILLTSVTQFASSKTNLPQYNVEKAFTEKSQNVEVADQGIVIHLLKTDTPQYIIKLSNGQTILLKALNKQDNKISLNTQIQFIGRYNFNNKGGSVSASKITILTPSNQNESNLEKSTTFLNSAETIANAFKLKSEHIQVKDKGVIIKLLPDDTQGIKHQKFLIKVNNITILISHNIDLAPRIPNLKVKEELEFYGEYIWSNKGGLVHWTHHDPSHRHQNGWLKYKGKLYQ